VSVQRFYCHNSFQDFTIYNHKEFVRSFFFGQCSECGKYFQFDSLNNRIVEGKEAEKQYKEIKKDIVKYIPELKYLKHLSYAVPAKKTVCSGTKDDRKKQTIEYQIMKINNRGKVQTISNTLDKLTPEQRQNNTIKVNFIQDKEQIKTA
jgi:hypothetical protein